MSPAKSTPDSTSTINDDVIVMNVLAMGTIPQLQNGESYASNGIPGLVGRVLDAFHLPAPQNDIQRIAHLVTESLRAKGIIVKHSRALSSHGTSQRAQARWRKTPQDLSAPTDDEQVRVEDIATAAIVAMHGSTRSLSSIESAAHIRLNDHGDIPMSRMRIMTDAVIARIEALMEQQHAHTEVISDDSPDEADEDYADSDPEADLVELAEQGIDPKAPTSAKPGSEEKVLQLAARYAAGEPFWQPRDQNEMTSPIDEDRDRRRRVEESKRTANRIRDDLQKLQKLQSE